VKGRCIDQQLEPPTVRSKTVSANLWYPVEEWRRCHRTNGTGKRKTPPLPKIDVLSTDGTVKLVDGENAITIIQLDGELRRYGPCDGVHGLVIRDIPDELKP